MSQTDNIESELSEYFFLMLCQFIPEVLDMCFCIYSIFIALRKEHTRKMIKFSLILRKLQKRLLHAIKGVMKASIKSVQYNKIFEFLMKKIQRLKVVKLVNFFPSRANASFLRLRTLKKYAC